MMFRLKQWFVCFLLVSTVPDVSSLMSITVVQETIPLNTVRVADRRRNGGAVSTMVASSAASETETPPLRNLQGQKDSDISVYSRSPKVEHRSDEIFSNVSTYIDDDTQNTTTPTPSPRTSPIDLQPRCVAHHEFAFILPDPGENLHLDHADDYHQAQRFLNRNGEIRYYYCRLCSICPHGVRIISRCHKRRDTMCSADDCIHPHHVFYPSLGGCYPVITRNATTTRGIFVPGKDGNEIDEDARPIWTTAVPNSKTIPSQFTIITIGVVSLNALVFVGLILRKRNLCKRLARYRIPSNCVNNSLTISGINSRSSQQTQFTDISETSLRLELDDDIPVPVNAGGAVGRGVHFKEQQETVPLFSPPRQFNKTNLNIFNDEPRSDDNQREASVVRIASNVEKIINGGVSVLRGTSPYWLVMMGHFGPEGGVLYCEDSDVVLEIPPGAIPASHPHQLIKAKVSLCPDAVAPELSDPESLLLTPLVELESPGLDKFITDVRIKLPHYARMEPGWTFRTHYTNPTAATRSRSSDSSNASSFSVNAFDPWFSVEQKSSTSKSQRSSLKDSDESGGVTFTVNPKYITISTSHFSKYVCRGCHKDHPLHFEAVVYGKHVKVANHEQIFLNVYIIDAIKDSENMVQEREGSKPVTQYVPIILNYKKKCKDHYFLEVHLEEQSMPNDWQWKLETYNGSFNAKQEIPIKSLVRCCTNLKPFVQTFTLVPKTRSEDEPLSLFQAVLSIGQQNAHQKIIVHMNLLDKGYGNKSDIVNNNGFTGGTIVTDNHIDVVVKQLPVQKWRPLFRKLMGSNVENEIDCIIDRDPKNVREQMHHALATWKRSLGMSATVKVLCLALESEGLAEIAQSLREDFEEGIKDDKPLKNIENFMNETTI